MKKAHFRFHIILALILLALVWGKLFAESRGYVVEILEQHEKILKNRKDNPAIYLAINTNINVIDSWCPYSLVRGCGEFSGDSYLTGLDAEYVQNHKLGLYLGKIVFEKNKQGNLTPKYLPSNIENLEQELEKINPLWLDELNKDYGVDDKDFNKGESGQNYRFKSNKINLLCKNSKENITLNKEQALSYIRELHTKNTILIKDYINAINQNKGIKVYYNLNSHYDKLAKEGIIPPNLLSKYNDGTYKQNKEADLIVLDYLKSNNEADSMVLLNDELFYTYLIWSLKDFVLELEQGMLQDNISLLFNPAAYIDDKRFDYATFSKFAGLDIEISELYQNQMKNLGLDCCGISGFFNINPSSYFSYDVNAYDDNDKEDNFFQSLNKSFRSNEINPSALGNYYFYLVGTNKEVYAEYFQRIYPSITNPPKAWSKEMMKKLDLKLE